MAIYLTIKWLFGKINFLKMGSEQGVGIHKPSFDCGRPKSKIKKKPYKRSTVRNSSHQSPTVSHEATASSFQASLDGSWDPIVRTRGISGYLFCLPEVGRALVV